MAKKALKIMPKGVAKLPKHAKDIYLAAFENAWKQYKDPKKRRAGADREETAHKVAWAAVKEDYKKKKEKWVKK